MSKLFAISALMGIAFFGSASNTIKKASIATDHPTESICEHPSNDIRKDCTVKLDMKLENGSTLKGELTFSDVTWWECTKMQVAAWWERNF